jgi:hypothetical protein
MRCLLLGELMLPVREFTHFVTDYTAWSAWLNECLTVARS